jgi:hypothetical protein
VAWVARNFLIALACAAGGFVIVALAGAAGLRAAGQDPIEIGEYVFTLVLFGWLAWPLSRAARRWRPSSRPAPPSSPT